MFARPRRRRSASQDLRHFAMAGLIVPYAALPPVLGNVIISLLLSRTVRWSIDFTQLHEAWWQQRRRSGATAGLRCEILWGVRPQSGRTQNRGSDLRRKIVADGSLTVEHKGDNSPVTIADRSIESLIRARIAESFPDHGIYGEEEGIENLDRRHVWVVDPIDGTKSFITGHPLFGGLLALLEDGKPRLGQIDMPATGERWCGVAGRASTLNGQPCRTSGRKALSGAIAYTTDPEIERRALERLRAALKPTGRLFTEPGGLRGVRPGEMS